MSLEQHPPFFASLESAQPSDFPSFLAAVVEALSEEQFSFFAPLAEAAFLSSQAFALLMPANRNPASARAKSDFFISLGLPYKFNKEEGLILFLKGI